MQNLWSPGGKETTHINRGTDFDTTPARLLALVLPLLLSLSLSSSSSPPSAGSLSVAAWSFNSCSSVTCGWWPGKTVPLPVSVAQQQPRFLRDRQQTEQHSGGDDCGDPVFMWMVTQPVVPSGWNVLQLSAQTDESSVELVLTSWVWHDHSLIQVRTVLSHILPIQQFRFSAVYRALQLSQMSYRHFMLLTSRSNLQGTRKSMQQRRTVTPYWPPAGVLCSNSCKWKYTPVCLTISGPCSRWSRRQQTQEQKISVCDNCITFWATCKRERFSLY